MKAGITGVQHVAIHVICTHQEKKEYMRLARDLNPTSTVGGTLSPSPAEGHPGVTHVVSPCDPPEPGQLGSNNCCYSLVRL